MRWITKAAAANLLSAMPCGRGVHGFLQRHVTRTLPPSERDFLSRSDAAVRHLKAFQRWSGRPNQVERATFLEFGAGWDLGIALTCRVAGVASQFIFDITRLARAELVRLAATRTRSMAGRVFAGETGLAPQPLRLPEGPQRDAELAEWLGSIGIEYRAPGDARRTGLAAGSVDCATSSFTLEHIPPQDIQAIFREMLRVLRPGGVMTHLVDMSDHFSHADPTISPWHFLRFPDSVWRLVNSDLLYQNRLRASSYVALAREAGFEIADAALELPPARPAELPPVHGDVRSAGDADDVLAIQLHLVTVRPGCR